MDEISIQTIAAAFSARYQAIFVTKRSAAIIRLLPTEGFSPRGLTPQQLREINTFRQAGVAWDEAVNARSQVIYRLHRALPLKAQNDN